MIFIASLHFYWVYYIGLRFYENGGDPGHVEVVWWKALFKIEAAGEAAAGEADYRAEIRCKEEEIVV